MLDQPTAQHRPDRGGDGAEARPRPDRAAAFLDGKGTADQSETAGHEERGAESLRGARRDQLADRGSETAPTGGSREERDPEQKNSAAPELIA